MCVIYNGIGSLEFMNAQLKSRGFDRFQSVSDIQYFRNNILKIKQDILCEHRSKLEKENIDLMSNIALLGREIDYIVQEHQKKLAIHDTKTEHFNKLNHTKNSNQNKFLKLVFTVTKMIFTFVAKTKLFFLNCQFYWKLRTIKKTLLVYNKRSNYISNHNDEAIFKSAKVEFEKIEQKSILLNQFNEVIAGAVGEEKVVQNLSQLNSDYILINDFNITFNPPMYRKQNDDYIKSIQIDHVLISRAGIFLIETKNWSQESITNEKKFSPTDQLKRSNYAFYRLLKYEHRDFLGRKKKKLFGDLNIPIRNLLVFIKNKPKSNFEYIKILNVDELLGYIQYFKPIVHKSEITEIANYLLDISSLKTIDIK